MSVVDENKIKLLRMKEKLLKVSSNNIVALNDYKKIVYEIDKEMYDSIADNINSNKDYTSYSLEKQLEILLSIEKEYNDYYAFRENAYDICEKYGDNNLELCDISLINIDEIRKRISSIKSYFDNLGKIENNRKELDELNGKLVEEEKKLAIFKTRVDELETELRQNILKAEGRVYNSSGGMDYASALVEAEKFGIDLKEMLNNSSALSQLEEETKSELAEVNERLKTAEICYNSTPNVNYREIYLNIRQEAINTQYKLVFLKIMNLISEDVNSYDEAVKKRKKLIDLLQERTNYLKQLGIKYLYDPFDRLQLRNQLEVINAYGKNLDNSKEIVNQINKISTDNDKCINENRDYTDYFKTSVELMKDNTLLLDIIEREEIDSNNIKVNSTTSDNQIVKMVNLPLKFMLDRAKQKAFGVINRVYEMVNEKTQTVEINDDVTPQLVIEPVISAKSNDVTDSFVENKIDLEDKDDGVFLDMPFEIENEVFEPETLSINKAIAPDNVFLDLPLDDKENKEELSGSVDDDNMFINNVSNNVNVTTNGVEPEAQLFQEVKPFEEVSLFGDRYDDELFDTNDKVQNLKLDLSNLSSSSSTTSSDVMPDVFWTTKDIDTSSDSSDKISFDEQIEALVESEKEEVKTRKLVS